MIELNISCPNVKQGGAAFGTSCDMAGQVTAAVRKVTKKPLIVKLSPNVTSITEIAKSVEAAGADAVSLINTLLGMRIDIHTKRPVLKNNVGKAIKNAKVTLKVKGKTYKAKTNSKGKATFKIKNLKKKGAGIFPVAVRMVWQTANAVKIPVIGMGGVTSGEDAIELMMAGASAVQVGMAVFTDPYAPVKIIQQMNDFLEENKIASVQEIIGTVQPW